jgi:phosphoribosyl 1,2-cyclic phosphodiesterase
VVDERSLAIDLDDDQDPGLATLVAAIEESRGSSRVGEVSLALGGEVRVLRTETRDAVTLVAAERRADAASSWRSLRRVRLRFLGTRGEIEARTRRHSRHSSLLVAYRRRELMIDCGLDWRDRLQHLRPPAIVLTHAHPDHAAGLRDDAPCPVYAPADTWSAIERYPLAERAVVEPRRPLTVLGIEFEAFPVEHSLRAPAVGYRVSAGRAAIFYAPDLVSIVDEREALSGLDLYIGDGAAVRRSIVRRRNGRAIGHASIRAQLEWCASAGVRRTVFTHCGSEIVRGDARTVAAAVRALGSEHAIEAHIAHDGIKLTIG